MISNTKQYILDIGMEDNEIWKVMLGINGVGEFRVRTMVGGTLMSFHEICKK